MARPSPQRRSPPKRSPLSPPADGDQGPVPSVFGTSSVAASFPSSSPFKCCMLQLRQSPSRDPHRSPVVVVVVDSSAVLTRNLVVPTHSCPMSVCAVVLVVHESTCLKHSPVPTNLPSVIRAVVRHLAGGAPETRSGVKSSRLGLWCTRLASSLSRHHSSAALWALGPPFCGTGQWSRPSTVVSWLWSRPSTVVSWSWSRPSTVVSWSWFVVVGRGRACAASWCSMLSVGAVAALPDSTHMSSESRCFVTPA